MLVFVFVFVFFNALKKKIQELSGWSLRVAVLLSCSLGRGEVGAVGSGTSITF